MPGAYVDGNDLFAMIAATQEAVDRARAGGGPSLIEAVTYRTGPHTTADDPGRYRDGAEEEAWRPRDPIERVRRYLERAGAWTPGLQEEIEIEEAAAVEGAVEAAEALPAQAPEALFDAMFAVPTPPLSEQRTALLASPPAPEG